MGCDVWTGDIHQRCARMIPNRTSRTHNLVLGEELGSIASINRVSTLFPSSRANLAVFCSELERFQQTQRFLDVTAHGCIVDRSVLDDSLRINDEGTPLRYTIIRKQNVVVPRQRMVRVGYQRKVLGNVAQSSVRGCGVVPRQLGVL